MYFYKIEARMTNAREETAEDYGLEERRFFRSRYTLHDQDDKEGTIIISSLHEYQLILGAIARTLPSLQCSESDFAVMISLHNFQVMMLTLCFRLRSY